MRRVKAGAAALVVAVTAAALSGCGGTSHSAGPAAGQSGKGKVKGSIDFAWWGGGSRSAKTNAVIKLFRKAHPGVQVHTTVGEFNAYFQKLNVQAAGENLPCVPQMQARQLNDYTKRHTLMPLDNMVRSGAIDVSGIPKKVLDTGRGTDGKLYMVPYGAAYDGTMYNRDMARRAGVGDLKPDVTWDQWEKWLLDAQRKLPSGARATALDGTNADLFISYVESHGASLFKGGKLGFGKSMLADYWNMWERLRTADATITASAAAENANVASPAEQGDVVLHKAMSATTPGNQLAEAQPTSDAHGGGELTMTTHPFGPAGIGNVLITSGLSISASCDNVPTAASFIDFFTNDEQGAKAYASDNGAVTVTKLLKAQLDDPSTSALKKKELSVYQDIVRQDAPVVVYPSGYQQIFVDAFTRDYQDVAFGRKSVRQAVDAFFQEATGQLQR
ncbi:MAG: extracellular solute-binding protein [Actinocatenispora sp.]